MFSVCEVHDIALLGAFRTCYNIHLMSTSSVITITAKATLDQMLGAVFQRLEQAGDSDKGKGKGKEIDDESDSETKDLG